MKRETHTFLNLVRDAQDPTPADEARVLFALRATLATGAASSAVASAVSKSMPGAPPGTSLGAIGSKWLLCLACTAAAVIGPSDSRPVAPGAEVSAGAPLGLATPARPGPAGARLPGVAREPPEAVPERTGPTPSPRQPVAVERRSMRRARAAAPPPEASPLRAELELLARVQRALRHGDAEDALRTLDAHRSDDRVLLAERRAARILALCGVGRVAEARAAAAAFEREHPESVQGAAIASSCANPR
jgi:hypothetical protein